MIALETCMDDIREWMDTKRLKMNATKTEFILFGSHKQLQKCITNSLNVNGDNVERSYVIKYFSAWLDEKLSFKVHIKKKCQVAMMNFQCIRCI